MYDVLIIGAGPSGLTASVFASCYKINHLVLGKQIGGQLNLATNILNYPGFNEIAGPKLVELIVNQAKSRGAQIVNEEAIEIKKENEGFSVITRQNTYQARVLILATGTERRKLNVPGEVKYTGRGVYYCANCEPFIYKDKDVVIAGGGNAGFQAAVSVCDTAKSVVLLEVGDTIRAEAVWLEKVKSNPKVTVLMKTKVLRIEGDEEWVRNIVVSSNNEEKTLNASVLFVEIGGVPGTALVAPLGIQLTQKGFISVDHTMQTSIPGVFAAGDIVGDGLSLEQLSTAIGLGARAAASAYFYIKQQNAPIVWGKAEIRRV